MALLKAYKIKSKNFALNQNRLLLLLIALLLAVSNVYGKDFDSEYQKESTYTLNSILKIDEQIIKKEMTGSLLKRFDIYRKGLYEESKKANSLIPSVWSLRPTLDTTYLYDPYIQKYPLSCEIAAVRMVMQSLGTRRSEESLVRKIPYSPSYLSGGIWGDPDEEFVGYLTGTQGGKTGYGIYEKPLSKILEEEGYKTEILNRSQYTLGMTREKHLIYLITKIKTGSRVILWGDWCTSNEEEDGILDKGGRWILRYFPLPAKNTCTRTSDERKFSWKTEEGKMINGIAGEHTFLLLGYIGTIDKPTHIIVWDTYTGRHIFSYTEWMRKWNLLENRSLRVWKE